MDGKIGETSNFLGFILMCWEGWHVMTHANAERSEPRIESTEHV